MTDNEILKALECCSIGTFACGKGCPCYSVKSNLKVSSCRFELMCELSDLVNRQKAEIERLSKLLDDKCDICIEDICIEKERAKAINEFWETLKVQNTMDERIVSVVSGDRLAKEMTEGKEDERNENN